MKTMKTGHFRLFGRAFHLRIVLIWLAAVAGAWAVDVPRYGVFEASFTHTGSYGNPYTGTSMTVTFTHSSGSPQMTVDGFWNGGSQWLVRFAPAATGTWNYSTSSGDGGLNAKTGSFNCVTSANKGFIKVSTGSLKYFQYSDGTPFLWIGDTNWDFAHSSTSYNGSTGNFKTWIDARASQKFTLIQGQISPSGGGGAPRYPGENEGGRMFTSVGSEVINPGYFQNMDSRVQYIMSKNLVLAFWFMWADDWATGGVTGSKFDRYARYVVARYGAYNVIWGVSGEYEEIPNAAANVRSKGDFIKSIDPYKHLLSTHTTNTTTDDFGANPATTNAWIDFHGQQYWEPALSTVNQRVLNDRAATFGAKPVVNMEYGYEAEAMGAWTGNSDLTRKAHWTIMMAGGFASYGEHQIAWDKAAGMNWTADLNRPAALDIQHLRTFFDGIPWWEMTPQNSLITSGTGFVLQKANQEYDVYLPGGGSVTINLSAAAGTYNASWYDPRNGGFTSASPASVAGGASRSFTAPDSTNDWLLRLTLGSSASGPAAQWNLNESTGTTAADASGNGNTGTLVNGPVWTSGVDGNALDFDGSNDYVNVANSAGVNLTKNLTLSAWIAPDTVAGTMRTIIGKVTDMDNKQYELSITAGGALQLDYEKSGNNYMLSGGTVAAGTWQHAAVTIDGSLNVKIYLDGAQVAGGTAPAETGATSNPMTIGRAAGTYNSLYFGGLIDDVRIYNSALGAAAIADLAGEGEDQLAVTVGDSANAADWSIQDNLQAGNMEYGDRAFTFASVPASLLGLTWIRTANDSKAYTGSSLVAIHLPAATDIYVAHNDAITAKPSWMTGWTDTGLNLVNNEAVPKTFSLFVRNFAAGSDVTLGASGSITEGMYSIVLKPVP